VQRTLTNTNETFDFWFPIQSPRWQTEQFLPKTRGQLDLSTACSLINKDLNEILEIALSSPSREETLSSALFCALMDWKVVYSFEFYFNASPFLFHVGWQFSNHRKVENFT
jgi:hypothetical protein